jgi:lipid-A-disaccharide synthase
MSTQGGDCFRHYRHTAYMGFVPVLLHLPAILSTLRKAKEDILAYQPDVLILIDYPGFNLKVAAFVKKHLHIPVCYYISPKLWAWKRYRIRTIRRYIDRMYCILPFEEDFYRTLNYSVEYVGNPTVDSVEQFFHASPLSREAFFHTNHLPDTPCIALLPGSRRQEIRDNLPLMLQAASFFQDYTILVAAAPGIEPDYYHRFTRGYSATLLFNQTYLLLHHSAAALVTSGTATLEAALLGVPQAVCYKTPLGRLVRYVFRHFFGVRYISLVNLIVEEELVRELFGDAFTLSNLRRELSLLLNDEDRRKAVSSGYASLRRKLGTSGAAQRTASRISGLLNFSTTRGQ